MKYFSEFSSWVYVYVCVSIDVNNGLFLGACSSLSRRKKIVIKLHLNKGICRVDGAK